MVKARESYSSGIGIDEVAGNCLVSIANSALGLLGSSEWDPDVFRQILPGTNFYYLEHALGALKRDLGMSYTYRTIKADEAAVLHEIKIILGDRSLCHLAVNPQKWINQVLGRHDTVDPDLKLHAIMVSGYYAPLGIDGPCWLYIVDSYCQKQLFIPFEEVFGALPVTDNQIYLAKFEKYRLRFDLGDWLFKLLLTGTKYESDRKMIENSIGKVKNSLIKPRQGVK